MNKKHNNSMRASALQITFISLLAVLLTLGAAPARNQFGRKLVGGQEASDGMGDLRWLTTGSLGVERSGNTATLLPSGKVLVAGGSHLVNGNFTVLSSVELYDPATGSWSPTGSLGTARAIHTATLLPSGKVLVTGGFNGFSSLSSAELYDPATGSWSPTGSLATGREIHTATLLPSGKVLVAGGFNGSSLS